VVLLLTCFCYCHRLLLTQFSYYSCCFMMSVSPPATYSVSLLFVLLHDVGAVAFYSVLLHGVGAAACLLQLVATLAVT